MKKWEVLGMVNCFYCDRLIPHDGVKVVTHGAMAVQVSRLLLIAAVGAHSPLYAQATIAGFTPGAFRVSETGAATYEIPIKVPPGTAGMEPKLSLVYNSQAGNGLLGLGWALSGLSAITRCPRTQAQDGARGGVNHDVNDRFCLDGQRLILVSGSYGGGNSDYRTERESFSKVTVSSATIAYPAPLTGVMPQSFTVKTKAGLTLEYGATVDSRILAQGKTTIRLWALNKIMDVMGNYLTVAYDNQGNATGEHKPVRIEYARHATKGAAYDAYVEFAYESRGDAVLAYEAGSQVQFTERLTSVKTFTSGGTGISDLQVSYGYGVATGRSRVSQLKECAPSSNQCFPAILTDWLDGENAAIDGAVQTLPNGTMGVAWDLTGHLAHQGDFNGDGRADLFLQGVTSSYSNILLLADSAGKFTSVAQSWPDLYLGAKWNKTEHKILAGDFNADGRTDLFLQGINENNSNFLLLADSDGRFNSVSQLWPDDYLGIQWNANKHNVVSGDFNGDGRADLLLQGKSSGDANYLLHASSGGQFTAVAQSWADWYLNAHWNVSTHVIIPGDFNGDARTDLLLQGVNAGYSTLVLVADDQGGFSSVSQSWPDSLFGITWNAGERKIFTGDFNGDGRTDVLLQSVTGSSSNHLLLSGGAGTFDFVTQSWSDGYLGVTWNAGAHTIIPGDYNGDGRTDLLLQGVTSGYSGLLTMANSSGEFTTIRQSWPDSSWGINWNSGKHKIVSGDFDGDGRSDLFLQGVSAVDTTFLVHGNRTNDFPDILSLITTGLGVNTSIAYKPLTQTSIYTRDSDAVYPIRDLQVALYVVSAFTSSDGIGGTVQTNYTYAGAKADLNGRGFLGFRQTQSTYVPTGIKTLVTNRQDWPYVGLPSQLKRMKSDNTVLGQMDNAYACKDFDADPDACAVAAGKRYFPYVSQVDEKGYELDGAFVNWVRTGNQFDLYGNATSVAMTNLDASGVSTGYSKTTTNTFVNDTTNWLLGRLTRSTVESAAP